MMTPDIDPTDDRVKDRVDFEYEDTDELNSHQKDQVKKAQRAVEKEQQQKGANMRQRKRLVLKGLTGVAVIVVLGLFATSYFSVEQTDPTTANRTLPADAVTGEPWAGNNSSSVTVVEFGDFACPVCRQFEASVYPKLKEQYIDTGEIKFVFMNFQFISPSSDRAAIASECVYNQDRQDFWSYYEAIYDNQGPERQDWATQELLTRLAREETDINMSRFRSCLTGREEMSEVQQDYSIGQAAGVSGTPTIFVNGRALPSFGFETISQAIEDAKSQ